MNSEANESFRDGDSSGESLDRELEPYFQRLREISSSHAAAEPSAQDAEAQEILNLLGQLQAKMASLEGSDDSSLRGLRRILEEGRIEKYAIRELVSQGGQAMTILAFDPDLHRQVLLKISHSVPSTEQQAEILREGRALARVRSNYVAQCYAAERLGRQVFLVMEYISGESLAQRIDRKPPGPMTSLGILAKICEGLAEVHACGLLHRDLKPANIMLDVEGHPKIVDFGLATALGHADLGRARGTVAYMPPEQARAECENIDARTDIFGVGAIFYEMLTGTPPYAAETPEALLELAKRGEIAPAKELVPELPQEVNEICMRCLDPAPKNRFASVAELGRVLEQYRAAPRRWRSRAKLAALGLVGLLALAIVLCLVWMAVPPWRRDRSAVRVQSVNWDEYVKQAQRRQRREFFLLVDLNGGVMLPSGEYQFVESEKLSFHIDVDRDSYVGIFSLEENRAVQLFPNQSEPDSRVRAGRSRTIPGEPTVPDQAAFDIIARYSGKTEVLHIFAATAPWKLEGGRRNGEFFVFDEPQVVERWLKDRSFEASPRAKTPKVLISEWVHPYRVVRSDSVDPIETQAD